MLFKQSRSPYKMTFALIHMVFQACNISGQSQTDHGISVCGYCPWCCRILKASTIFLLDLDMEVRYMMYFVCLLLNDFLIMLSSSIFQQSLKMKINQPTLEAHLCEILNIILSVFFEKLLWPILHWIKRYRNKTLGQSSRL